MVVPGLALRVSNGWMFPFLLTFQKVLNRAQHLVWVHQQHLFPLLLPLLPVDLHAAAALHSLLERVLGSPIAKAHLSLAGP